MNDYAIVQDPHLGYEFIVHRADCPAVRQMAADDVPVMTMFGCESLPEGANLAPCLQEHAEPAACAAG